GPLGIKRSEDGKLRIYYEKNIALWGGAQLTLPKKEDKNNINKFASVLIAGPLSSLLFGLVILLFFLKTSLFFLLLLGAMSTAISVATLIPMRAGAFYTDGGRWLRIKKGGFNAQVEIAIYNLIQSNVVKGNWKLIDIEDTEILKKDKDPINKFIGHCFASYYYRDCEKPDEFNLEKESMKILEKSVPKSFVKMIQE
ncbi:MAG: hypothetical protein PHR06_07850, partial [Candidatus Cloacimonetes bacterium]|nr:hypothetical protein [Candidatus Cloacimonadota bacterium]